MQRNLTKELGENIIDKHQLEVIDAEIAQAKRARQLWYNMLAMVRGRHPSYKYVGGKGVTVHPRWSDSFDDFLKDVGLPLPTEVLRRIDLSKGYEPGNVVWMDKKAAHFNRSNDMPDRITGWMAVDTPERALAAAMSDARALSFIPPEFLTMELLEAVVAKDSRAVISMPQHMLTQEVANRFVAINWRVIRLLPSRLRSPEAVTLAVKADGMAIRYCPMWALTRELAYKAVDQNAGSLRFIPSKALRQEIRAAAREQHPGNPR